MAVKVCGTVCNRLNLQQVKIVFCVAHNRKFEIVFLEDFNALWQYNGSVVDTGLATPLSDALNTVFVAVEVFLLQVLHIRV